MAAYLLLSAGSSLTLGDIEAWAKRARALGADASTPVELGHAAETSENSAEPQLSVPVHVTRTVLPDA